MSDTFPWTCPYCNHDATIGENNWDQDDNLLDCNNKDGKLILRTKTIVCPNDKCREYTIAVTLFKAQWNDNARQFLPVYQPMGHWNIKPQSRAKVFPSYIPPAIIADYNEACLIRDLSPKASATLSRRCIQGMIRDFHGVTKSRLVDEIDAIKNEVDSLTWEAIDAVRHIGNIGAHMEKDINLIIDVDSQEASALISLIELLLKDWYVTKHEKEERLKGIVQISEAKKKAKTDKPASAS